MDKQLVRELVRYKVQSWENNCPGCGSGYFRIKLKPEIKICCTKCKYEEHLFQNTVFEEKIISFDKAYQLLSHMREWALERSEDIERNNNWIWNDEEICWARIEVLYETGRIPEKVYAKMKEEKFWLQTIEIEEISSEFGLESTIIESFLKNLAKHMHFPTEDDYSLWCIFHFVCDNTMDEILRKLMCLQHESI